MKRILKIPVLAFIIMLVSSLSNKTSAQPSGDVSYQTFYDELSPYGRWIDYPGQGYVWVPDADPDFRPYSSNGHWVWTEDYEWMWVSDYDWGWAPFHYGRWDNDPSYGWYWVPGYEWSPAWVAWRDGGDYYGWAPIRPGINISIDFNIGSYSPPYDFWSFAPRRYISSPRIYDYCVDRRQNVAIINYTTIINNNNYSNSYGFRSGPSLYDVERYTGRINPVRFRDSYRPGRTEFRNNEVSIYRPRIQQNNNNRFSPRQFERYNRQGNNGNDVVRNDNGFRRNDYGIRRDNNANTRDNNLPVQRERDNNSTFERRNNNPVRQPQNNNDNNNPDRRRNMPERSDNNTRQPNNNDERRVFRPSERPVTNPNQNNNLDQNNNNNNRRFERRDGNNANTNMPTREQRQDTRNDNNNRSNQQPVQQPEQRRTQEQPRQFERKDDGNRQQNNNGNGGFRNSRKRD